MKQSKRNGFFHIVWSAMALFLASCAVSSADPTATATYDLVSFTELVTNPGMFDGMNVCTGGVYVSGWEASALGTSTVTRDELTHLTEPAIWIEGAEFTAKEDCFRQGGDIGPPVEFCQATLCGRFEFGGRYGHLGAYYYQLRGEAGAPTSSGAEPHAESLAGPTPAFSRFRSDQFHLEVSLPPVWVAAEGPIHLAAPFVGLVAFNSWGEFDFWAPALMEADDSLYWPLRVLAQVPDGEAYAILIYGADLPARGG